MEGGAAEQAGFPFSACSKTHPRVRLGGTIHGECGSGVGIEMRRFSALKICSFMHRAFMAIGLISLHYGSGQLLVVHAISRQYRESKSD